MQYNVTADTRMGRPRLGLAGVCFSPDAILYFLYSHMDMLRYSLQDSYQQDCWLPAHHTAVNNFHDVRVIALSHFRVWVSRVWVQRAHHAAPFPEKRNARNQVAVSVMATLPLLDASTLLVVLAVGLAAQEGVWTGRRVEGGCHPASQSCGSLQPIADTAASFQEWLGVVLVGCLLCACEETL